MFCPKGKSPTVIWIMVIFLQSQCPPTPQQNFVHKKKHFHKKYRCLICHLRDLYTCFWAWVIPVSVHSNFQQIFCGGWAETKTFLCLSFKQPNFHPKRYLLPWTVIFFKFWSWIFFNIFCNVFISCSSHWVSASNKSLVGNKKGKKYPFVAKKWFLCRTDSEQPKSLKNGRKCLKIRYVPN